ncbi:MAG: sugar kinase [Anaerolineae bacterium]|nr:sugar kinase [Anaerolineae bacterium]
MGLDIVSLGEPLVEFNGAVEGSLREVQHYSRGFGGDTSNFAVAAARLGAKVGYVCRVGADGFADVLFDMWAREGIDTTHVTREDGAFTGIYFVNRQNGQHSWTYYRRNSAASHITPADVPADYITSARLFQSSGAVQALSNTACDTVFHAMRIARSAGIPVCYDPNFRPVLWGGIDRGRSAVLEAISLADIITPSIEDARALLPGDDAPETIARRLFERGPRIVILTLGGEGAILVTRDGLTRFPPFPVEAVDATGAGDAFTGGFLVAYLEGHPLDDCVRFASAAGALTCTGPGAVNPIPQRAAVDRFLASTTPAGL